MTLGGGLMCVWERSVVRSAFSLMSTFVGVAGLVRPSRRRLRRHGADPHLRRRGILALLLFGVLLSPPDLEERKLPRVLGGLGLMGAAVAWVAAKVASTVSWAALPADELPPIESNAKEIGIGFIAPDGYVVPFELAAVLLTVALVAAVYIARRKMSDFEDRGRRGEGEV